MWVSSALEKSNDVQDIAKISIFICDLNSDFTIFEELLLSLEPLKDTTTGKKLCECVIKFVEEAGLQLSRLASVTLMVHLP